MRIIHKYGCCAAAISRVDAGVLFRCLHPAQAEGSVLLFVQVEGHQVEIAVAFHSEELGGLDAPGLSWVSAAEIANGHETACLHSLQESTADGMARLVDRHAGSGAPRFQPWQPDRQGLDFRLPTTGAGSTRTCGDME